MILLLVQIEKKEEEGNEIQETCRMHNTIAQHLLMDAHPIPEQQSVPSGKSLQFIYWA